jgi:hypothetical protein
MYQKNLMQFLSEIFSDNSHKEDKTFSSKIRLSSWQL